MQTRAISQEITAPGPHERVRALRLGLAFVIVATLAILVWAVPTLVSETDIERFLEAHRHAWEAGDGAVVDAMYLPTGRFVYLDEVFTGEAIGRFVSGLHAYEFDPLDSPVVATNPFGGWRLSVVAWKAQVTIERTAGDPLSGQGLALFRLIETDGTIQIRSFEFVTQP